MTKFRKYYQQMLKNHPKAFTDFKTLHHQYARDRSKFQEKFNHQGKHIIDLIQEYETKLCSTLEKGQFGKYSAKLAEKFRQQVKKDFPLIDFVGITITNSTPKPDHIDLSNLTKISPLQS